MWRIFQICENDSNKTKMNKCTNKLNTLNSKSAGHNSVQKFCLRVYYQKRNEYTDRIMILLVFMWVLNLSLKLR